MHTSETESVAPEHDGLPRVDFYVLRAVGASDVPRMACRITEKAWKSGHRIFVQTGARFTAHQMDALLWTFRAESFIPHVMDSEYTGNDEYPVSIGDGAEPRGKLDVVVNLGDAIPSFLERCERIVEIVSGNAEDRTVARERYRLYRKKGCSLHTHNL
uniref:DNA polymerase III, chi subunit n=1 Tax=Candidatus Kentrum sp. LPFa TaxID=2126335 RepID=A0A450W233_9GAMM|nr:MAG: DNA polymerase III, chi subunit [Candidatus Kentron sp. LPFa]